MEELIMVALKFKANLRSRVSGLLTSSVERCSLMATEESRCCRRKGEEKSKCTKNSMFANMKVTLADRFLVLPGLQILLAV